jgi:lysophospholipase L1-like esterase
MSDLSRPQGPFRRMVVLGESTVEGGGWVASPAERYADVLWKLLEHAQEQPLEYVNAGIGGSVISPRSPGYPESGKPSAAERLDEQVIARAPDLLLIAYGLNDMRSGMRVTDFRRELEQLIDRVDAAINAAICLVNVYYMPVFARFAPFDQGSTEATRLYNCMLQDVADARGLMYADVHSAEAGLPQVVNYDGVHANKIGNLLIAHRVFEALVRGCPGLARNVCRRDETSRWTRHMQDLVAAEATARGT